MPEGQDLPEELQTLNLTRRNAHELSDRRWVFDVADLAKAIQTSLGPDLALGPIPASDEKVSLLSKLSVGYTLLFGFAGPLFVLSGNLLGVLGHNASVKLLLLRQRWWVGLRGRLNLGSNRDKRLGGISVSRLGKPRRRKYDMETQQIPSVIADIDRELSWLIQRQHDDGGWGPISKTGDHRHLRTYSTIMALWALVEAQHKSPRKAALRRTPK